MSGPLSIWTKLVKGYSPSGGPQPSNLQHASWVVLWAGRCPSLSRHDCPPLEARRTPMPTGVTPQTRPRKLGSTATPTPTEQWQTCRGPTRRPRLLSEDGGLTYATSRRLTSRLGGPTVPNRASTFVANPPEAGLQSWRVRGFHCRTCKKTGRHSGAMEPHSAAYTQNKAHKNHAIQLRFFSRNCLACRPILCQRNPPPPPP